MLTTVLIQDPWPLYVTLNVIDTITFSLGLPSLLEGPGLGVNPTNAGAGTRALLVVTF